MPDGRRAPKTLARHLGISLEQLRAAVVPAKRRAPSPDRPIVHFDRQRQAKGFSVRAAFSGKQILLIGVTGFIGKVWLANTLMELPGVKRIYLLIRRQKSNPGERRFEKMIEDSPVFDPLFERHGDRLPEFLREKVEVVEGDVTESGLGLTSEIACHLQKSLDLIINSSGLTDFNPDLRDALATNTDAAVNVVEFVRGSDHAGLLHLSTCYVAGEQDGRVTETLIPNYNPRGLADFDAEQEWRCLHETIREAERQAGSEEVTAGLRIEAQSKEHAAKNLQGAALENQIRKGRVRWLKTYLTEAGTRRAKELGWPNTYTLSKSLAE
jgi:long-chain acyl-CoA synthetase